jgi:hypothetical protein
MFDGYMREKEWAVTEPKIRVGCNRVSWSSLRLRCSATPEAQAGIISAPIYNRLAMIMWSDRAQVSHVVYPSDAAAGTLGRVFACPHRLNGRGLRFSPRVGIVCNPNACHPSFSSRSTASRLLHQSRPDFLFASSGAAEVALPRSNISNDGDWTAIPMAPPKRMTLTPQPTASLPSYRSQTRLRCRIA